jgi:putative protein-disulfide isomerase
MPTPTLHYFADPMCSWCWGFREVRDRVLTALPQETELHYVMGGLAPDCEEPMDADTRSYVQDAWKAVQEATGAEFNWEFWERCTPRRSTYPACRAVIAAGAAGAAMFDRIQEAYYIEARNPSDRSTLVTLAGEIGLDEPAFATALAASETELLLKADLDLRRSMGVDSFPTLILDTGDERHLLTRGYANAQEVLARLP